MTGIEIVNAEDMKPKRLGKYHEYVEVLPEIRDWIKYTIEKSKDRQIIVSVANLVNEMGTKFVPRKPTTIYRALKFVMPEFEIRQAITKSNDRVLIFKQVV